MRLLTCLAVLLLATSNVLGDGGRREEAHAHSTLGKVEFDRGRYAPAMAEFKRAYELAPVPELLFNIARCQEQLGDLRAAIASYDQYLAAKPNAEDRAAIEAQIESLRRSLPPAAEPPAVEPTRAPPAAQPSSPPAEPRAAAPALAVAPAPPAHHEATRSRRGLWIGLGVGAGVVLAGAVVLGVLLSRPTTADPYGGNFNPPYTAIRP